MHLRGATLRGEAGAEGATRPLPHRARRDVISERLTPWSHITRRLLLKHEKLLSLRVDKAAFIVADLAEATASALDAHDVPHELPRLLITA